MRPAAQAGERRRQGCTASHAHKPARPSASGSALAYPDTHRVGDERLAALAQLPRVRVECQRQRLPHLQAARNRAGAVAQAGNPQPLCLSLHAAAAAVQRNKGAVQSSGTRRQGLQAAAGQTASTHHACHAPPWLRQPTGSPAWAAAASPTKTVPSRRPHAGAGRTAVGGGARAGVQLAA